MGFKALFQAAKTAISKGFKKLFGGFKKAPSIPAPADVSFKEVLDKYDGKELIKELPDKLLKEISDELTKPLKKVDKFIEKMEKFTKKDIEDLKSLELRSGIFSDDDFGKTIAGITFDVPIRSSSEMPVANRIEQLRKMGFNDKVIKIKIEKELISN